MTATAAPEAPARAAAGRVAEAARRPVAADSAAVFRIVFGLVVAGSSFRFLAKGWVDTLYLAPAHHLTYVGFEWVRPWPAPWMQLHVLALAVLGLCIAAGHHHRAAAALFAIGFTYTELIDAALYLNHYWFVTLAAVLIAVLPVHHRWSVDAWRGRVVPSSTVPAATVWALRAQVAVVYVFAGLAKLNADWLLEALPLRLWLPARVHLPVVGPLLAQPATAFVLSWSGALFDCTIVGWLLWRRSRPVAYAVLVAFHLGTAMLFQIGVFPWLMIGASLVFFPPDWPSRLRARVTRTGAPSGAVHADAPPRIGRCAVVFLVAFAVVQVLLPLRHLAYPGDVRWTDEGYYGSWRVMLTEKTGYLEFRVRLPDTGEVRLVDPRSVLEEWQVAQASIRPDLLHAAARIVADEFRAKGAARVEVYADAFVSFMGGPATRLVDPDVDLAALPRTLGHQSWILPMSAGP